MRTKCSGGERCTKCIKDHATDLAESLDRIDELQSENQILVNTMRSLASGEDFDPSRHSDVLDILSKYSVEPSESKPDLSSPSITVASSSMMQSATQDTTQPTEPEMVSGEITARSDVGSPGKQGELSDVVDLDGGSGASGFIGKMSEMSWFRSALKILGQHHPRATEYPDIAMSDSELTQSLTIAKDFSFYMDDVDVLAFDEDSVDPYEWPSGEDTYLLTEAFFHAMQGAFPFVVREFFLQTMLSYPREISMPTWSQRRWLAQANLVWAIGAKWLHISKLNQPSVDDRHVLFYARARALGLDHRVVSDHPDIDRVQGIGLLAFYLLINGSITRAWNTLGHATRHATALGLHLRVTDPVLDEAERARRARTWYALYCLEILIAEITGRPKSIFLSDVTTPTDLLQHHEHTKQWNVEDGDYMSALKSRSIWLEFLRAKRDTSQAMTGGMVPLASFLSLGRGVSPQYFPYRIRLCRLSDKIAAKLYSGTSDGTWAKVQRQIGELQTDLRFWNESLPDELNLQSDGAMDTDPRARIELALYYHSVQMILHRPCLCEVIIENQSFASQEFNLSSARACVHAAMSLLAIMPDNPSAHESYQLLPWWALLHYVTQATAVFMLEMALGCQHFKNEIPEVVDYLRKAMAYIWCMTQESLSAYRAWRLFRNLLSSIQEENDQYHAIDIPQHAPVPKAWTNEHEAAINKSFSMHEATDTFDPQSGRRIG
ncbi:hypothetical protein LTR20_002199 [Exophiala xenobiotica]|nr:hypothetical protein LTS13_004608 [Exophiala xenobiotica]KAK5400482.1 hypothetical protein LTR79_002583 [Exophiala xenobiotica]KAK5420787.1 hypothetical protein LTR90_003680 [Exophiala xenobiotica]KAK5469689.1 hypothetical protein LTR20_002199 [Exophiala xenobiotica]KAK5498918.1 hypothetical protein LTR83_004226 [Exophiala xenobiotica]